MVAAMDRAQPGRRSMGQANKFWQFKSLGQDEGELLLYGEISDMTWWGDEVTPKQFLQDLKDLGDIKNLTVRINSPGGDVFAAQAIYTNLREHPANITVKIDGIAASAATIVAMAGDTIMIPEGGFMMIHNPLTVLWGMYNADDLDKMSETLAVIKDGMINNYAQRTGLDKKAISKIMNEETWYTGQEAIDAGFADKLMFQESNDQKDAVMDGNRIVIKGVGFDMAMLPQRVVASFSMMSGRRPGTTINHKKTEARQTMNENETVDSLRAAYPALVAQIEKVANTAGAEAERKRILAIDELDGKIDPAMLKEARKTAGMTAEAVAMNAVKEGKFLNNAYLAGMAADAQHSGAQAVPGTVADTTNGKGAEDKAALAHVADIAKSTLGSYSPKN